MCGRLSLTAADHRAAAMLLADAVPGFEVDGLSAWLAATDYRRRYNVGPGQTHLVVRGRSGRAILDRGTWGFELGQGPGKSAKLVINARAEGVAERPLFRAAFARGRCLIPADGFFEWERRAGQRLPHWFRRADHRALLFAALLSPPRFSIITVPASAALARIHDRMPAIIEPEAVEAWLFEAPAQARALLQTRTLELESMRVSPAFNSASYDQPIEALA